MSCRGSRRTARRLENMEAGTKPVKSTGQFEGLTVDDDDDSTAMPFTLASSGSASVRGP